MMLLVKIFVISLTWAFVQSNNQRDKLFFLQKSSGKDNETLVVVTWTHTKDKISAGCEFFTDKDLINEVLELSNDSPMRTLSEDEMKILLEDCTEYILRRRRRETDEEDEPESSLSDDVINDPAELSRRTSNRRQRKRKVRTGRNREARREFTTLSNNIETTGAPSNRRQNGRRNRIGDRGAPTTKSTTLSDITETTTDAPTTLGYSGMPFVYPGTKWCGAGDIAKGFDDLGLYQDTDRCCRAHDLCNDTLAPGETRHNLTNESTFTKLSCRCDQEFYDCLTRVNTFTSNTIGNMYFNILQRGCYRREHPFSKECKKFYTLFKMNCKEYERNRTAPKVYQWIPAQAYKNIPVPGPLKIS